MMLVAGFSGIGKTAVVNEVHKPIVKQRGYFIKGKFDQFNRNIPFSAFVQAFRDLMGQLLSESDEELANWKAKIIEAVGSNGQVLIAVIPELEHLIGAQPEVPELSGSAAQNRFNLLFQKFIAVFTTPEHPLVMFLDDLQWADLASLNLMKVLMSESERGYLLLLGAYRDNEVFPAHPLMLTLGELTKQCNPASAKDGEGAPREHKAAISTLTLAPLPIGQINRLVAETLSCTPELAQPLTELVYQKTKGNPFFTTQFLKGLYEDALIIFNADLGYWECNLVQVRDAALTDDVVEFMAGRLMKLPQAAQDVLKLAACIGNQFDLDTLAIVCESSAETVAANVWGALREGLILPITEAYKFFQAGDRDEQYSDDILVSYRFLHDRVQQAAYTLIPEDQKPLTHFNIGQLLLKKTSSSQIEEKIFGIVGHLNIGLELMTQRAQRDELAHLNLIAGKKAKICTAYTAAFEYLNQGLEMLAEDSWQTEYQLTLNLYLEITEVSYLKGDFELMEQFVNTVLDCASSLLDKIPIYETELQAYAVKNEFIEGIQAGLACLKLLGVDFPDDPNPEEISNWLGRTKKALSAFSPEEILSFSEMSDPTILSVMRILSRMIPVSFFGRPNLLPLISCQGILLSLEYGNTAGTPVAYVNYALVLCSPGMDSFVDGYKYGRIGTKLTEQQDDKVSCILAINNFYSFVSFWREHIRNSLPPLMDVYQIGLEVGELEFSMYALTNRIRILLGVGRELPEIRSEFESTVEFARSIKCEVAAKYASCQLQALLNLINLGNEPWSLKGDVYDEDVAVAAFHENHNLLGLSIHYFTKIHLNYLFGRIPEAINATQEGEKYIDSIAGFPILSEFALFTSLTHLAAGEVTTSNQHKKHFDTAKFWSERLNMWADNAPMNYQHKADLVEAERQRILGNQLTAIELYDRAIAGAQENQYIQEEALANELAAKFYLDWGKEKIASTYLQEAYYCYARWGAKAKTDQLEEKYPQLLSSILQQQRVEFSPLKSLDSLTQKLTASRQKISKNSSSTISELLDFTSILQAAQTLSSTIELEQLLEDIVRIVLTNAGAQKAVLLIPQAEEWQLRAMAQLTEDGIVESNKRSQLLTAESSVPIRVIQYVKHTREPVLIDEGKTEISGIIEGYLLEYQPQSVLCVPLLNQGQLVAIMYLEHPTTKAIFTPNRLTIIQFLCAQAAVSLQNAQLYSQVQQALKDLQEAQKMRAY